jgi:hypothetical protein
MLLYHLNHNPFQILYVILLLYLFLYPSLNWVYVPLPVPFLKLNVSLPVPSLKLGVPLPVISLKLSVHLPVISLKMGVALYVPHPYR